MVAGHLQQKKGYWYVVLTYTDENGKPASKWKSTGLKIKGNKRKAEKLLEQYRREFDPLKTDEGKIDVAYFENSKITDDMEMQELCIRWLNYKKLSVEASTYAGYHNRVCKWIRPYFLSYNYTVREIGSGVIQEYIEYLLSKGQSIKSAMDQRDMLNDMFRYAIILQVVPPWQNPVQHVPKLQAPTNVNAYYEADTAIALLDSVIGSRIEIPVFLALYYGLRRSEVAGLMWDAIDFKNRQITISHVVVAVQMKGYKTIYDAKDRPKNRASHRTFPLLKPIEEMLLRQKAKQKRLAMENKKYYDSGYVFTKDNGMPYTPGYISGEFKRHLERHGLPPIRFHDLRHSCASVLLADPDRRVSLKDIQLWLGHSNIQSTMRYAHLGERFSKAHTAECIENALLKDHG